MKTYKVLREEVEKNIKKYEEYVDRFNQINEADQELLDTAAYGSGKYVKLQNKIVAYNNVIINIYTEISTYLNKVENLNHLAGLYESIDDVLKTLEQKSEEVKSRMNGVRLFSLTYMNLERDLLNLSTSIKEYTDIAEDIKNIDQEAKRAKEEQDKETQELLEAQNKAPESTQKVTTTKKKPIQPQSKMATNKED